MQSFSQKAGRGNEDVVVLPPAARIVTTNSADLPNRGAAGCRVYINVTAAGTGSITPKIQGKDPVSGAYFDILTGVAITANGLTVLTVYPGVAAAANVAASDVLPATWRVVMTANNANPISYSVGANTQI